MQYLQISKNFTLSDLADRVGDRNVEQVLVTNSLSRVPNVGQALSSLVSEAISSSNSITPQKRSSALNTFAQDSDLFEKAALLDDDGWKVLANTGTFEEMLKIPETLTLPDSDDIMGNGIGIGKAVYDQAMQMITTAPYSVDPAIFNDYSTTRRFRTLEYRTTSSDTYQWFKLPWGKVSLYSSLGGDSIDFPVYPEEVADGRVANYTQMPDLIYQYEPWYLYESSGPRSVPLTFHMHRHMWTGDHNDGKANELIRFCEANCYPQYNGSAVHTSTVTLYISGSQFISGILTSVDVEWSGPLADDGWYLEFTLKLNISEVSTIALDYNTVRNLPLIGR